MSAISENFLTCDCDINFGGFIIWSENPNSLNLFIKESSLVSRGNVILNKTVKSFPLELFEWNVFNYHTTFLTVLLIKKQRNISNILIMTVIILILIEVWYRRSNNSTNHHDLAIIATFSPKIKDKRNFDTVNSFLWILSFKCYLSSFRIFYLKGF